MLNSIPNFIGTILIVAALSLCAIAFLRPKLFRRQDIVLIIALLISGGILFPKSRLSDEFPQFSIILLTLPAIFYTVESIRLRGTNKQ